MDAETRKTLEAMAECEDGAAEEAEDFQGAIPLAEEFRRGAAAIRAALAEVDALTQQVATLESAQWACHVCGKRIAPGGGSIVIAHDDECRCADRIADLEARAIPKELLDTYAVDVECYREKRIDVRVDCRTNEVIRWSNPRAPSPTVTKFPTLSAALSAAKEAP